MSRIGKQPIKLAKEVKVRLENNLCLVEGPKHKLQLVIPKGIKVEIENDTLLVKRQDDSKPLKSLHGTIQVLIKNMIKGVTEGFKKELEVVGVGYKAQIREKKLVLNIGFSRPVEINIPESLKVSVPSTNHILIEGIDKQEVGEFAAKVRRICPPQPYKDKGIRYVGEEIRRKLGKALAKA